MKPVFQDKFYEPGLPEAKQRGNCWPASIASIIEADLAAVPGFFGDSWYNDTLDFLESEGWFVQFFPLEIEDYVLKAKEVIDPGEHYIMTGLSPRGNFRHAVVYRDGKLAHDPHPSGAGLVNEEEAFLIRRYK